MGEHQYHAQEDPEHSRTSADTHTAEPTMQASHPRMPQLANLTRANILALQRTIGNQAVQRLLAQRNVQRIPINDPPRLPLSERMAMQRGPVEVTVIDDSDIVGWIAAFTRTGEVYMTNVRSMVANVLSVSSFRGRKISRLNILDHGNTQGIEIGNDFVTMRTLGRHRPQLAQLHGKFAAGGFVHIQHCEAGQNRTLVIRLAQIFGVPVYAGTGAHNPVYRFNLGEYVRGNPDGSFDTDVGRP